MSNDGEQRILEPREVDVLCGRGGMSNHHPWGNEWYRRLIRSNRPLYRACPKHTKLLVSKAIVQAVESQGGRFLERSKGSGYWYQVSYKRAVDKTSQGLRERDREEDPESQKQLEGLEGLEMPDAYSGKSQDADLNELAELAINQARKSEANSPTSDKRPRHDTEADDQEPKKRSRTKQKGADDALMPPTLEEGQSSMFRLLKHTKLLPGESWADQGQSVPFTGFPANLGSLQTDRQSQGVADSNLFPPQFNMAPQVSGPFGLPGAPSAAIFGLQQPGLNAMASTGLGYAIPPSYGPGISSFVAAPFPNSIVDPSMGMTAPGLTRLSTQVSDWINPFYPVTAPPLLQPDMRFAQLPDGSNAPSRQDAFSLARATASRIPPPVGLDSEKAKADVLRKAPPIATLPPPRPAAAVKIKTVPPPGKSGNAFAQKRKETAHVAPPAQIETSGESGSLEEEDAARAFSTQRTSKAPAHKTELEQSVSATLLKLASTPSRLFSGLTSFFDRAQTDAMLGGMEDENGSTGNEDIPAVPGTKRSKNSLLDDDEETPMEARLRTVQWK